MTCFICNVQPTEHGQEERDESHAPDLNSWADYGSKELREPWRPEHIAMYQLPAALLHTLLKHLIGVVPGGGFIIIVIVVVVAASMMM